MSNQVHYQPQQQQQLTSPVMSPAQLAPLSSPGVNSGNSNNSSMSGSTSAGQVTPVSTTAFPGFPGYLPPIPPNHAIPPPGPAAPGAYNMPFVNSNNGFNNNQGLN